MCYTDVMKIRIKLYALLGTYLPPGAKQNEADIDVDEGATVADVIRGLKLPAQSCHLVLVNGVYVGPEERAERVLAEGEALAIWPPVAGG